MLHVLLVKMSSMCDVIHALYAVEDAARELPGIQFDWVVEEAFADLPALHGAVREVFPVAIRRWRGRPLAAWRSGEPARFLRRLRSRSYDLILDAQGLAKSGMVTRLARGFRVGLDARSAREALAALAYQKSIPVPPGHAIGRLRELFGAALGYMPPESAPALSLGLVAAPSALAPPYVVLVHGTTWESKEYPLEHWQALAELVTRAGYRVVLPAGNEVERRRAGAILADLEGEVAHSQTLGELARSLAGAAGVVSVDSGLGHLADALGRPLVALFGSTNPVLTGPRGVRSEVIVSTSLPCVPCLVSKCRMSVGEYGKLHPPCFDGVAPESVWTALRNRMDASSLLP